MRPAPGPRTRIGAWPLERTAPPKSSTTSAQSPRDEHDTRTHVPSTEEQRGRGRLDAPLGRASIAQATLRGPPTATTPRNAPAATAAAKVRGHNTPQSPGRPVVSRSGSAVRASVGGATSSAANPAGDKTPRPDIRRVTMPAATGGAASLAVNPAAGASIPRRSLGSSMQVASAPAGGSSAALPGRASLSASTGSISPRKGGSTPQAPPFEKNRDSTGSLRSMTLDSPRSRSQDGAGKKLFVLARCRPLVKPCESCLEIQSGTIGDDEGNEPPSITILDSKRQARVFSNFHAVIDSREQGQFSSQEAVYNVIGPRCVADLSGGQSCCVFAYGQTGTGKSHTLIGVMDNQQERGVLPRLCSDIFSADPDTHLQVSCSVVELYNDQIRDLLRVPHHAQSGTLSRCRTSSQEVIAPDDGTKVTLRSTPRLGTHIDGAQELVAHDSAELLGHCKYASSMRAVAETVMNSQSSRSHAIFIIKLEWPSKRISASVFVADLAGHETEKTVLTTMRAERLRELSFINTTLLHLRQVISALADKCSGRDRNVHVPYRNSKLTMMLEQALEGSGRCTTVVTLTAESAHYDENLHTLRFAADLSDIRTKPMRKPLATKAELLQVAQEEIETLKRRLQEMHSQSTQALADPKTMEEWSKIEQELDETKRLAHLFQSSWVSLKQKTKDHQAAVRKMGLAVEINGDAELPYLVNLSNDPLLAGTLCYELPLGLTALGAEPSSGDKSGPNFIAIQGLGVVPEMLQLETTRQMDSSKGLRVEARPFSQNNAEVAPRVLVNGLRLSRSTELKDGDRILLGCRVAFRLVMPGRGEAKRSPRADASPCLGLEEALLEAAGDSETVQALTPFTDFLQAQAGELRARAFLKRYCRIAAAVEEANQITRVMRRRDNLVFSVSVTMDLAHMENVAVDFVVTLSKRSMKAASRAILERLKQPWQQVQRMVTEEIDNLNTRLATWAVDKFNRRLALMRELYSLYLLDGDGAWESMEQTVKDEPWLPDEEDTRSASVAELTKLRAQSLEQEDTLRDKVKHALVERDALTAQVSNLTNLLEHAQEQQDVARHAHAELVAGQSRVAEQQDGTISTLRVALAEQEEVATASKNELNQVLAERDALMQQVHTLTNASEQNNVTALAQANALEEHSRMGQQQDITIAALREELAKAKEEADVAKQAHAKAKEETAHVMEEHSRLGQQQDDTISALKEELAKTKEDIHTAKQGHAKEKEETANALEERSRFGQQQDDTISTLKEELAKAKEDLDVAKKAYAQEQEEIGKMLGDHESIPAVKEELAKAHEAMYDATQAHAKEKAATAKELHEMRVKHTALELQHTQALEALDAVECVHARDKDAKLQDIHELTMKIKALDHENRKLRSEMQDVKKPTTDRNPSACGLGRLFH